MSYTSNDLLAALSPERRQVALNYEIVAQSMEELRDLQSSPSISVEPYLLASGQMEMLTMISIYAQRGVDPSQLRLLYMNAAALVVWRAMGNHPKLVGAVHRPPRTALLAFGVPFSE